MYVLPVGASEALASPPPVIPAKGLGVERPRTDYDGSSAD